MIRKAILKIGVPVLFALITWNAYLAVNHLKRMENITVLSFEGSAIHADISTVLKDLTDMETSQRGYLLTGNPAYLEPYKDASERIGADLSTLRTGLASRTQRQQSQESQLESLAKSKQGEIEHTIGLRQKGYRRRSFMLVDTDEGKNYMDEIRGIVSSLSAAESSNLASLNRERLAAVKKGLSASILGNAVILLLAAGLLGLLRRHERLMAEEASRSRNELELRELELRKLTSALSGQARSNLVAIHTNSQLLLENYGDFLPRQGHEYAVQMNQAAEEMELLRQDLVGNHDFKNDGNDEKAA
jgi:CHASE3 domain sensor protein